MYYTSMQHEWVLDTWVLWFIHRRFNQVYYHYDISHLRDSVQYITYDKDDHYDYM